MHEEKSIIGSTTLDKKIYKYGEFFQLKIAIKIVELGLTLKNYTKIFQIANKSKINIISSRPTI